MPSILDDLKKIKTLIIDNYDSYTYNLLQLCDNLDNVVVIKNDQYTWPEFKDNVLPYIDNIILSPGPGRPERPSDFGLCTPLLEAQLDPSQSECHRPIFGICLGHQGIAHILGGRVTYAPRIMHGRLSQIFTCNQSPMFAQCTSPFWAVRYHSLVVDRQSLPESLILTAYCYEDDADTEALRNATYVADGQQEDDHRLLQHPRLPHENSNNNITVMGFQHRTLPLWGVQFHPESISTEYGTQMMRNFASETIHWYQKTGRKLHPNRSWIHPTAIKQSPPRRRKYRLLSKELPSWIDPQDIVEHLQDAPKRSISWLDSSRKSSPYSRMSILSIDPAFSVTYSTLSRKVDTVYRDGTRQSQTLSQADSFFDYLSRLLSSIELIHDDDHSGFCGGLVGYFGYEMKRESMQGYKTPPEQQQYQEEQEPDAGFHLVDRFWIFDWRTNQVCVCCLYQEDRQEAEAWLEQQAEQVAVLEKNASSQPRLVVEQKKKDVFATDTQRERYLQAIARCTQEIKEGESYELCLTTRFFSRIPLPTESVNYWHLYTRHLRQNNPAPFSAFLSFPQNDLTIMSSSPERFFRVESRIAEMKPIKGTMARAACSNHPSSSFSCECITKTKEDAKRKQRLWQDVKERAENLMIVDLIRNDLAQVCEPATVKVPKLMHVETYEKVHHLVSTVRGQLRPDVCSVQALRQCFPPGSMTGAPKLRSVQLLDQLEEHQPRGVYSGCLGYFSLDGSADFSVVIRTAVAMGNVVSVGAGGAVTFLSDPEKEWKETLLKTKSVIPSIEEYFSQL